VGTGEKDARRRLEQATSLHDYDLKMPNFTFHRGRKQAKANE